MNITTNLQVMSPAKKAVCMHQLQSNKVQRESFSVICPKREHGRGGTDRVFSAVLTITIAEHFGIFIPDDSADLFRSTIGRRSCLHSHLLCSEVKLMSKFVQPTNTHVHRRRQVFCPEGRMPNIQHQHTVTKQPNDSLHNVLECNTRCGDLNSKRCAGMWDIPRVRTPVAP